MPHRQILQDALNPGDLQIAMAAFDSAFAFLVNSGDAQDDPEVKRNLAHLVILIFEGSPDREFFKMTDRAIAAYRHHQALTKGHSRPRG